MEGLFLIFTFPVLKHKPKEVIFVLFKVNNLIFLEEDQIFYYIAYIVGIFYVKLYPPKQKTSISDYIFMFFNFAKMCPSGL